MIIWKIDDRVSKEYNYSTLLVGKQQRMMETVAQTQKLRGT